MTNPFEPDDGNQELPDYGNTLSRHDSDISDIQWLLERLKKQYTTLSTLVVGLQNIVAQNPAVSQVIAQANSFHVGQVIYYNPSTSKYEKGLADAEATAEVCGIVTSAAPDIFSFVSSGYIDTSSFGLLSGYIYYVSPTNAGALTTVKPLTVGHVQKPILLTVSDSLGLVVNMRGMVVELMIDQHVDTTSDVTHKSLVLTDLTANRAMTTDAAKKLVSSAVTDTELGYVSGVTSAIQTQLNTITTKEDLNRTITQEPTGFLSPADVVVTYDATTQKITLTGTTTAYWRGVVVSQLVSGWVSEAHTNTTGHIYYLYFDGSNFAWSTDTFPGFNLLNIAIVYYRASAPFANRECHGVQPWQSHLTDHYTMGTFRESGGDITGVTLASTTASERRPDVSACTIYDQDLPTVNAALTSKLYSQRYITLTNTINYNLDAADIVPLSGNNPYYNQWDGAAYVQTLMPDNSLMTVWLYEVPCTADTVSQKIRHAWVQGQSITQAQNGSAGALATALVAEGLKSTTELNLGASNVIASEYIAIHKFIIQYTSSNWSIVAQTAITGTHMAQVSAPAGNYLSGVTTDATLSGIGTAASPLTVTQSYVLNTGDETVAGVKTFGSFPVTPSSAPTTDYQVANKKFVDDAIAGVSGGGVTIGIANALIGNTPTI